MLCGTKANSSRKIKLYVPPRTPAADVAYANILEPFSSSSDRLFQVIIPCCNQIGRYSYAFCIFPRISCASCPLFARIPTVYSSWNNTHHNIYPTVVVVLPTCRGIFAMQKRLLWKSRTMSS